MSFESAAWCVWKLRLVVVYNPLDNGSYGSGLFINNIRNPTLWTVRLLMVVFGELCESVLHTWLYSLFSLFFLTFNGLVKNLGYIISRILGLWVLKLTLVCPMDSLKWLFWNLTKILRVFYLFCFIIIKVFARYGLIGGEIFLWKIIL